MSGIMHATNYGSFGSASRRRFLVTLTWSYWYIIWVTDTAVFGQDMGG